MHCQGKRLILPELLDTLPAEQARASLQDLVRINRRWGGHSTLRRLLKETVPDGRAFSVLDVGAASGDMGACIRQWYPAAKVTSLDYVEDHLTCAAGSKVAGDAFRLPFGPKTFDYVFCSLFLHHFRDEAVVELLRNFGAVARKGVLVIDLERHPIPYYFIAWSRPLLGWDPVTVHDGAISVEAAFRKNELLDLARQAGLRNPSVRRFRPAFRLALRADSA
ncbi:MAG: methyltransferase domain-containing protein [Acidobacteriia bacterium]|nr:methyltransferase domain-containing protein [Terriglobia bacterium]